MTLASSYSLSNRHSVAYEKKTIYMTSPAPQIISLATATADHRWEQMKVCEQFGKHFPRYQDPKVQLLFKNSGIEYRNFVIKEDQFNPKATAGELHDIFREHSIKLARKAAVQCLEQANLGVEDIDYLVVTTCTGYVCPGLSARLACDMNMKLNLQRADLVGMGCSGAMPSLQRAYDFVKAYPGKRAMLITVEISSACWFVDDTIETVVGNTICADGAAAAIVSASDERDAKVPSISAFSTLHEPKYLETVGFEFVEGKNRIILAKEIRNASGPIVKKAVDQLLDENGMSFDEVDHWIIHSGGRRVLDAINESLGFSGNELEHSREVLRCYGNMSSPTILFVLHQTIQNSKQGGTGVMVALGPGLVAETALLHW